MIPPLLIAGLLTRRLWVIAVGAMAWSLLLLVVGVIGIGDVPLTAFVGGVNLAVGVLLHRVAAGSFRRARSTLSRPLA